MPKEEKPLCTHCNKALVSVGTSRSNGKQSHEDWEGRKLHKKCWLILAKRTRVQSTKNLSIKNILDDMGCL